MIELLQGDCLEIMPTLETQSFDAIIADIPYGTTACSWDTVIPFAPMWENLKRLAKPRAAIVLFGSQPFTSALIASNFEMFKWEYIWNKERGTDWQLANIKPLKAHENMIVFGRGAVTYNPQKVMREKPIDARNWAFSSSWNGEHGAFRSKQRTSQKIYIDKFPTTVLTINGQIAECNNTNREHPTQKPVALMEYLIRTYTNDGDTVLDFTMGSGSTLVAAVNTNRNGVGIELREDYYSIAQRRVQEAQAQTRMELA